MRSLVAALTVLCLVLDSTAFAPGGSFVRMGRLQKSVVAQPRRSMMGRSLLGNMVLSADKVANPMKPAQVPYEVLKKLPEEYAWILPEDGLNVKDRIAKYVTEGQLETTDGFILVSWMENYIEALKKATYDPSKEFCVEDYFAVLAELVRKERNRPHYFNEKDTGVHYEPCNTHHEDTRFFDYQQFGIEVTRPLIDWENSEIIGHENLVKIKEQLEAGDNVVFCSNHQSESDTHCMFTMFEDQMGPTYGKIAKNTVFIAGERVLRDAIVVPFSRGCNLLTVYSKKHIDSEPELKAAKMSHNQRTMKQLGVLFYKGGTCMWFAPSGGRDRRSAETGSVELSSFDANSIEMIRQVADKAGALKKTHFYAMALATHNIFPPPTSVGGSLGEERRVNFVPLRMGISEEIEDIPLEENLEPSKMRAAVKVQRQKRAEMVFERMKADYTAIKGYEQ